ncbi:MAG: hypothetical protein WBF03_10085 [Xanthobacteraceae bacterium]
MIRCGTALGLVAALLLSAEPAPAEEKDKEPVLLELGVAGEWSFSGGSSLGPTAALDIPVIADWLEIEAGVTALLSNSHTEWESGVIFKKPYALNDSVEFEIGAGPAWLHTTNAGRAADSLGAEAAIEFQIWPWPDRRLGWYVESSYGYDFGKGHEQSLGLTMGLLIPIR